MRRPRFLPRLGLRARITIAFAVGAFFLSALLAGGTWGFTRQNQLEQRSDAATGLTVANAAQIAQGITSDVPKPKDLVAGVPRPTGAHTILFYKGEWYPLDPSFGEDALPGKLKDVVERGDDARMRYSYRGHVYLAVGVKLDTSVEAAYFEIVSLDELEQTLETLAYSLIASALVTTLCGAGLGWWAARRVLRPLSGVSSAAKDLADGQLSTRVEASADPDLAPLATSFNEMASSLEQRIERDARFASNVSHELRSPLTTLSASITVLENHREDMPERARAALDLMVADVNRFRQLIEDLLEISRFDAGVMHLDLNDVRIAELVMQAVSVSSDADIPLDIDHKLAGVVVEADKRRLMRVIANLVDNAAKYGGGATRVELRQVDDQVQVAVEDDGPGIPEEDRDRIFDRFSRGLTAADRRTAGEGVGLGLSLVREHVRLHGGQVWVEDRPDGEEGARFVVLLPAVKPSDEGDGTNGDTP